MRTLATGSDAPSPARKIFAGIHMCMLHEYTTCPVNSTCIGRSLALLLTVATANMFAADCITELQDMSSKVQIGQSLPANTLHRNRSGFRLAATYATPRSQVTVHIMPPVPQRLTEDLWDCTPTGHLRTTAAVASPLAGEQPHRITTTAGPMNQGTNVGTLWPTSGS